MATPITRTIGQLFSLTGGNTCAPIQDALDAALPGWTEDTVVDVLTYCEGMRNLGQAGNVNYGIYRGLNASQVQALVNWAMTNILSYVPNGYSKKADLLNLQLALNNYVAAPTAPKKAAILATAKAMKPDTTQDVEIYVLNAFKGLANSVANNTVTADVITDFMQNSVKAAARLLSLPNDQVEGVILTKLEQIIGIRD